MRILFILKKNHTYGPHPYGKKSSGLWNSTRFIVEGLKGKGVHAHIVEVRDNNDIDREVTEFQPKIAVIEALWVVPEKFEILKQLHPNVKWYIHLHSHIPFLATEGIAIEWLLKYQQEGIGIIVNSIPAYEALKTILPDLIYLPNVYLPREAHPRRKNEILSIGCFGAIRPLKNQLLQALAAIQFAKEVQKPLCFWINSTRVELGGGPILKNIRELFEDSDNHLIENPWYEPEEFLWILRRIDIGLQVSLSETFNVVTADYITAGVPIVVSKEMKWVSRWNKAQDDSITDIVDKMHRVYKNGCLVKRNRKILIRHSRRALQVWYEFATIKRPS